MIGPRFDAALSPPIRGQDTRLRIDPGRKAVIRSSHTDSLWLDSQSSSVVYVVLVNYLDTHGRRRTGYGAPR